VLGEVDYVDPLTQITKRKYRPIEEQENARTFPGVLIVRIEDGLFFGNINSLRDSLKRVELHGTLFVHPGDEPSFSESSMNGLSDIILDMSSVTEIDARYSN
jgi:MFS superfamily sulfate permease-like transporter